MIIYDGTNMVFGRLASTISKELMKGEQVALINAEKVLVSGDEKFTSERYKTKRALKNKSNPEKSPKYPRVPHLLVKRMVRGMLPWKKAKGRNAYRMLKVYSGKPENIEGNVQVCEKCRPKNISKYITVKELCKHLGYEG
ncbi:50S ribosomal protein L13 [Candidatus Micrarchaeota archaeon]|nr:50S ribosomal protein L13 [Candidatus Micrarchaeota archaeon]